MSKKYKCLKCGNIPERVGFEVHEDTYGICSNEEEGQDLFDGVESMSMEFRANVNIEIGLPVYCTECGNVSTTGQGFVLVGIDGPKEKEAVCFHEYVTDRNVEDGVKCIKCGALWTRGE